MLLLLDLELTDGNDFLEEADDLVDLLNFADDTELSVSCCKEGRDDNDDNSPTDFLLDLLPDLLDALLNACWVNGSAKGS